MSRTIEGIELDQINSGNNLSDGTNFNLDYFTQIECIRLFDKKIKGVKILSVKAEIEGNLSVYTDGKEIGKLYIGKGVENIHCNFEYINQLSVYFRPDDKLGEETFGYNVVKVRVI